MPPARIPISFSIRLARLPAVDHSRFAPRPSPSDGHVRYDHAPTLRRQQRMAEAIVNYHLALEFFVTWLSLLENQHEQTLPHLERLLVLLRCR